MAFFGHDLLKGTSLWGNLPQLSSMHRVLTRADKERFVRRLDSWIVPGHVVDVCFDDFGCFNQFSNVFYNFPDPFGLKHELERSTKERRQAVRKRPRKYYEKNHTGRVHGCKDLAKTADYPVAFARALFRIWVNAFVQTPP